MCGRGHTGEVETDVETDPLDEALTLLAATAPEYGPYGLTNHGPMAAEALVQLKRADAVPAWTAAYALQRPERRRLAARPGPGRSLPGMVDPLRDRDGRPPGHRGRRGVGAAARPRHG